MLPGLRCSFRGARGGPERGASKEHAPRKISSEPEDRIGTEHGEMNKTGSLKWFLCPAEK